MEFSLRDAKADDFEFLFALHAVTLRPYVEELWGWDEDQQRKIYADHQPLDTMQIIQVAGRDVGVLSVEVQEFDVFLRLIEIHPEMQGQGLGSSVIESVLAQGRNLGKPVRLRVLANNPARNLYQRLGFKVVDSTETHYMMKCQMT